MSSQAHVGLIKAFFTTHTLAAGRFGVGEGLGGSAPWPSVQMRAAVGFGRTGKNE